MIKKRLATVLLLSLYLSGCAKLQNVVGISSTKDYYSTLAHYNKRDYVDHLHYLGEEYLKSRSKGDIFRLSSESEKYLTGIYDKLLNNNEILLGKSNQNKEEPKFSVIKSKTPFYFSVPGPIFFFSSGLIKKYLENEEMLVAVMAFETVKSIRHVYEKQVLIPVGYIGTDRILATTRIPLETKMETHKWAYSIMKRAGYDASAYLNWLQTQNKNTVDFILQFGDSRIISREEFLFKNFIVSHGGFEGGAQNISNSSKAFYELQKELNRETL